MSTNGSVPLNTSSMSDIELVGSSFSPADDHMEKTNKDPYSGLRVNGTIPKLGGFYGPLVVKDFLGCQCHPTSQSTVNGRPLKTHAPHRLDSSEQTAGRTGRSATCVLGGPGGQTRLGGPW